MAHNHQDREHDSHDEEVAARVKALETLLVRKGLIDGQVLDLLVDTYEHRVGPRNGAKVVARAWTDPAFRKRLLADAPGAVNELGIPPGPEGIHLIVLENTPRVHNVVVCTLCSCYPWPVLGLPPIWYKSPAYRARVVSEPREVLREFGTELGEKVEIRVWDSSAEVRYLVLPMRPAGTEKMNEEELAEIVTRDSMIGVAQVQPPRPGARRTRNGAAEHRA
jgi:nitrile hydratase